MKINNIDKIIDELQNLERKVIELELKNKFSQNELILYEKEINMILIDNTKKGLNYKVHQFIIEKIILEFYFKKYQTNELKKVFNILNNKTLSNILIDLNFNKVISLIPKKKLGDILEIFHIKYLNSKYEFKNNEIVSKISKVNAKEYGSIYTQTNITDEIVKNTINNFLRNNKISNFKILDFASGTGRFYFSAYRYLKQKLNLEDKEIFLKYLFAIDIDEIALDIIKLKIFEIINDFELLKKVNKNIITKNILLERDNPFDNKFDIIISNPPYLVLKINKKPIEHFKDYYNNLQNKLKKEIDFFKKDNNYKFANEGMLNYYKLSIEKMINLLNNNGELGVICPNTLFADISSKKLRKEIITKHKLNSIKYYPESNKIFENVTQSTIIFYMTKSGKTENIAINYIDDNFKININNVEKIFNGNYEIPLIKKIEWDILIKLSKFKKIKEVNEIRNKRGELDLSLYKKYITKNKTELRLVRGNMLGNNCINDKNNEYVDLNFLKVKSKEFLENDYNTKRLICPQISNMQTEKRLKFVLSNESDIIGNSCNYISSSIISLEKLNILLNSYLLNWRFKITSSNNHINNYEIDELPYLENINEINFTNDILKNNILICKYFNLNQKEIEVILSKYFKKELIMKELK